MAFIDTSAPRGSLNSFGRNYYNRHFKRLVLDGILQESDFDNFLELCQYYGEKEQLRRDIKAEGEIIADRDGNERRNPKQIRLKDVEAKFMRLSSRFALDPAGRKRVKIEPRHVESDFDKFLELGKWIDETFYDRCVKGLHVPLPDHLREYYARHGFGDPDNTASKSSGIVREREAAEDNAARALLADVDIP